MGRRDKPGDDGCLCFLIPHTRPNWEICIVSPNSGIQSSIAAKKRYLTNKRDYSRASKKLSSWPALFRPPMTTQASMGELASPLAVLSTAQNSARAPASRRIDRRVFRPQFVIVLEFPQDRVVACRLDEREDPSQDHVHGRR